MGDGVFPMIHIDAAFDGGTIFSGDRQIDGAGFFWFTGNNREIFAAYLFFAVMAERNAPLILCLAISRRPVVSRSKRFTARNTKCSPREANRYARAFASVFSWCPWDGWTGIPGALLSIMRSSSSYTISIGRLTGRISEETGSSGEKERQGVSDLKRCVQPGRCSVQADLLRVLFELDEDAAGISGIAEEGADGVSFVFICNRV